MNGFFLTTSVSAVPYPDASFQKRLGGEEVENFEMRNFILGCRNVSRKCKESNGGFSKLRKIAIGMHGIFK